ncbi:MAG: Fic family protein [Clostridia bacterium]|nr:Fic family protein [Clostridia bacterium]
MDNIKYITLENACEIHMMTIAHSGGGTCEHFDLGRLDSVLQNIQNDDYYPTFVDKLTHLFFCTCEFHCFADGNKRLAITLSAQFLLLNGYLSVAKTFFEITENISYQVAAGKINKQLLHRIMAAIMDNTYENDEELKLEIYNAIKD